MKPYLTLAIQAALDAGEKILSVYETGFDIETKDDNSPLTTADTLANDAIMRYLRQTDIPIISEENKRIAYSERKNWTRCWIVDPLDGTKEFIKRNGEFTVNIALIEDNAPLLGVIYVPVSKILYFTSQDGTKAYKIELASETVSVDDIFANASEIQPDTKGGSPVRIAGSRSHLNEDTKAFISEIEKENLVEIVSKGSSLKFCLVAEGAAHVYPRFAPTMEWDTAAGQAICEAVKIKVLDNDTQKPLRYNKENLLNPYFLVTA
ncbi:3'(2'),5'-bisphosphate nucleotidase CysQ [Altibacter sp.]|uniref:3'(2'),5'-bisphosphate nucleotidase CysQ n=1 Tax=Altibacter sp. TaxID=2024823 RepID=UPI000C952A57|nr:3'(2'),5'-bisphosphate nucleotidase CysQ [Altibacter sp.]MAP55551.1 3'(2'),5'-bisphosphate nucleotidase [Altibacter sp.]